MTEGPPHKNQDDAQTSTAENAGLTTRSESLTEVLEQASPNHEKILTEQLEAGKTQRFDSALVKQLKKVEVIPDKSVIWNMVCNNLGGLAKFTEVVGSKVAGAGGAAIAGITAFKHYHAEASRYLSNKLLLRADALRALPGQAADAVANAAKSAKESMLSNFHPVVVQKARGMFESIKDSVGGAINEVKDLIGDDNVQRGSKAVNDAIGVVKEAGHAVGDTVDSKLNQTVDSINAGIKPTVEIIADIVGGVRAIPATALGYLGTSFVIGGAAAVAGERAKEDSYRGIKPLIDVVMSNISSAEAGSDYREKAGDEDPRLALLTTFKRMSGGEDEDVTKYNFTKRQWIEFAVAARHARCSLLRDKTSEPEITLARQKPVLDEKSRAVISMLLNQQRELAGADEQLTQAVLAQLQSDQGEILDQYDTQLGKDLQPLEHAYTRNNTPFNRFRRDAWTFVTGGIRGTGIPTLWKVAKKSAGIAAKAARKAILPI